MRRDQCPVTHHGLADSVTVQSPSSFLTLEAPEGGVAFRPQLGAAPAQCQRGKCTPDGAGTSRPVCRHLNEA